jgi:hypothetical protein
MRLLVQVNITVLYYSRAFATAGSVNRPTNRVVFGLHAALSSHDFHLQRGKLIMTDAP